MYYGRKNLKKIINTFTCIFFKIHMKYLNKYLYIIILLVISALILNISLCHHRAERIFYWENEIYCDKGGYYVYLPAAFLYCFNGENFPDYAEEKAGHGFNIVNGKVITKYPYGTSLLMTPFFLITHIAALISEEEPADGFSSIYLKMTLVSGVFYLFLGLLFLFRFLRHYFDPLTTYLSLIFLLFGTNLFFYSTDEVGMSHVYSFALFSMLLYFNKRFLLSEGKKKRTRIFIVISVLCALIIIVRNMDVVFLPFVFLWDMPDKESLKKRIRLYLTWKNAAVLLLIIGLFLFPQMLYWKYAFNTYFSYSYGDEAFRNLRNPMWLELLFSPRSGMITFNPLIIFMIFGAIIYLVKRNLNGLWILLLFVAYVYMVSSWYTWSLGVSYGSRAAIDIYPFLAAGLAMIISVFKRYFKVVILFVLLLASLYNLNIVSNFRLGFKGFGDWDWNEYKYIVSSGDIFVSLMGENYYKEKPDYVITLKSCTGKYVRLQPDGSLIANGDSVSQYEKFRMIKIDKEDQRVALISDNSYYVCSDGNRQNQLWSFAEKRSFWESFYLINQGNGKILIKNNDEVYVSADFNHGGILIANCKEAKAWELFEIDTLEVKEE